MRADIGGLSALSFFFLANIFLFPRRYRVWKEDPCGCRLGNPCELPGRLLRGEDYRKVPVNGSGANLAGSILPEIYATKDMELL